MTEREQGIQQGLKIALDLCQADPSANICVNLHSVIKKLAGKLNEICGWCGENSSGRSHTCEKLDKYGSDWRIP